MIIVISPFSSGSISLILTVLLRLWSVSSNPDPSFFPIIRYSDCVPLSLIVPYNTNEYVCSVFKLDNIKLLPSGATSPSLKKASCEAVKGKPSKFGICRSITPS